MPDAPLHTLELALQTWPTRRRPDDTTARPRPPPTDQDQLVHAQHLFLRHQRATQNMATRPYAPLLLMALATPPAAAPDTPA